MKQQNYHSIHSSNQHIQQQQLIYSKQQKPNKYTFQSNLEYEFPIKILNQKKIPKHQFRKLMKQEAGDTGYEKGWRILKSKKMNPQRIYVRCIFCKQAVLYYKQKHDEWKLLNYKNYHIHKNKKITRTQIKKALRNPYNSQPKIHELYDNPLNSLFSKNKLLKTQENISKQFNFEVMKSYLTALQYSFRYQQEISVSSKQMYPKNLVASSLQQKQNYHRYGQSVSFYLAQNCLKELASDGKKIAIGIFSGFDNNNRILIFGFLITSSVIVQDLKKMFGWFFQLMGFINTTAIVIDRQSQNIIQALNLLKEQKKYKYHYVYDTWNFIRILRLQMKGHSHSLVDNIIQSLNKLMRETNFNIGQNLLRQLHEELIRFGLEELYIKLEKEADHIFLWKMPRQFIGFARHSNQCIIDLLKLKIQNEVTVFRFIQRLDRVSQERNKKCETQQRYQSYPFQQFFEDLRLKEVRNLFQKKIFNAFIFNYKRAQYYQIINTKKHYCKLINKLDEKIYEIQQEKCECGGFQKTGIPCQHLISMKSRLCKQYQYSDMFLGRWMPRKRREDQKMKINSKFEKQKKKGIDWMG